MNRRTAIGKATVETADLGGALLSDEKSTQFIEDVQAKTKFSGMMRIERRGAATGMVNRFGSDSRIIRASEENADDGYRAGLSFPDVPYSAGGIRLPFEITLDALHENIEGSALEQRAEGRMTRQFAVDLEDLAFNGIGDGADPFLGIDEGWIHQIQTGVSGDELKIDGSTINSGEITHDHLFAAMELIDEDTADASENELVWVGRRSKQLQYIEALAARLTSAGDRALLEGSPAASSPLGQNWVRAGKMPATAVLLTVPDNLCRVVTWDVLRFRVGPETDKSLAATKKVFYIWHIKVDHIIIDLARTVLIHTLDA